MAVESETYSALASGTPQPVLPILAAFLEKTIRKNEKLLRGSRGTRDVMTIFHCSRSPSLSIRQYLERIFKYSRCSTSCYVVAFIYIDRFLQNVDAFLTSLNVHRLLITSIMLAAKFLDDECHDNAHYARVGGVSTAEMNRMEIKLLFDLDFRLHVTDASFRNYCSKLEEECSEEYQKNQRQANPRPKRRLAKPR